MKGAFISVNTAVIKSENFFCRVYDTQKQLLEIVVILGCHRKNIEDIFSTDSNLACCKHILHKLRNTRAIIEMLDAANTSKPENNLPNTTVKGILISIGL
jgi:hypothetical protein